MGERAEGRLRIARRKTTRPRHGLRRGVYLLPSLFTTGHMYTILFLLAAGIVAIATHPQATLLVSAYGYLASAFIGMAITRFRRTVSAAAPDAKDRTSGPTSSRSTFG